MDKMISLKREMTCMLVQSLRYGVRKVRHRFEFRVSSKIYDQLRKKFKLGGHFKEKTDLFRNFKLPSTNKFDDGYKVDLLYVKFRVQKPKTIKFKGNKFETSGKLVVKFVRYAVLVRECAAILPP
jgi:hypothetical protein